jgi:flagellar basal-body rod modification protein FlgD
MTNISTTGTTLSTPGTTLSTSGTTLSNPSNNNLGQNDFLMLMMDQLKNQDPTSPSDPTQYLSELAGFSSLQQETQIAQSSATAATQQSSSSALGLLGRTVSYTDATGQSQSGTVTKVSFSSAGPSLTVGTASGIALGSVTEAS